MGVDVPTLFDVSHDPSDVSAVFDYGFVNLVVDHGDFVTQGDIVQRLHFDRFLGVHVQSLGRFTGLDVDGGDPDTVGFFMNQKLNHCLDSFLLLVVVKHTSPS
jgi:hypothetical protein